MRVLIFSIGFFLLVLGCVQTDSSFSTPQTETLEGCVSLARGEYAISPAVFTELPSPPRCFQSLVQQYHRKSFTNDFFFTEEYYLQPEFFPRFETEGKSYWTDPLETHYGAIGYGVFPPGKSTKGEGGQSLDVRFFLHSGFGVRAAQGMRLTAQPENPAHAEYFSLQLDPASQSGFILGPTFPIFDAQWVKDVRLKMDIHPSTPPGTYSILLRTQNPSAQQEEKWQNEHPFYYSSTSLIGEQTLARITVQVLPTPS